MYVHRFIALFAILGLFGAVAACDNPVEDDDHDDDHAELEGLVLIVDGEEVVRVHDAVVTGELHLEPGGDPVEVQVEFLDHDGDHIHVEFEDEFSLAWDIEDESVVTAAQVDRWSFRLTPQSEGETELTVMLMHGTHEDFTTPSIHVHVD